MHITTPFCISFILTIATILLLIIMIGLTISSHIDTTSPLIRFTTPTIYHHTGWSIGFTINRFVSTTGLNCWVCFVQGVCHYAEFYTFWLRLWTRKEGLRGRCWLGLDLAWGYCLHLCLLILEPVTNIFWYRILE